MLLHTDLRFTSVCFVRSLHLLLYHAMKMRVLDPSGLSAEGSQLDAMRRPMRHNMVLCGDKGPRPLRLSSHRAATLMLLASVVVSAALSAAPVHAEPQPATPDSAPKVDMVATPVAVGSVKVDGFVNDWEGIEKHDIRALTRAVPEYDWTGPRDLSLLVQLQYDSNYLYMAIEVRDNIVTTPKGRKEGDIVEVWMDGGPLATSKRRGSVGRLRMLRLKVGGMTKDGLPEAEWGYPKKLKGKPKGIKLDGSIRNTGYFFEVGLPIDQFSNPAPGLETMGI
ncbi:MAG: hypothetical protein AAFS10_20720, partial [Myxococcota bacterium]